MIELIIGTIMLVSVLFAYIPEPQYMYELTFMSNMGGAILFLLGFVLKKTMHKKLPQVLYLTEAVTIGIVFLISVGGTLSGMAHFNFSGGFFFCHAINPVLVFLYYVLIRAEKKFRVLDIALSPIFLLSYLLFDYIRFLVTDKLVYGLFPKEDLSFWFAIIIGLGAYVIAAGLSCANWGISRGYKKLRLKFENRKQDSIEVR